MKRISQDQIFRAPRRQFLKRMGGMAAVMAAMPAGFAPALLADEHAEQIKGPRVNDIPAMPISDHVHVIISPDGFPSPINKGMMSNITFVETEKGIVVIDSGASLQIGEMALRQLREITDAPVIAIFNSHYHGDHWLGNHAFVNAYPDVPIYAHENTMTFIRTGQGDFWMRMMENSTDGATAGTIATPPTEIIAHGDEFNFGDITIRCHHYGTAHTPADVCFEIVEDKVVHVGDAAMDNRIAFMDDGSYLGTFRTYDALKEAVPDALWLPAHGNPGKEVLANNRELFEGIYETALQAVQDMVPPDQVTELVLKDPRVSKYAGITEGFDDNIGRYTSLAYLEAEANAF
ncbi:MAG: MBL fold metallo-hydrolase [Halothiobacillaceae bacterium]